MFLLGLDGWSSCFLRCVIHWGDTTMQREWRRERGTVDSSKWLAWIDFGRALHQENMPFLSKKDSHPVPIRCHIMHPYALSACREWCDFCDFWRKPLKLQRKIRQRGGKCVSQEKKGQLKDLLQWSSRLHEPRGPEHRQYREMVECRLLYKSLFFFIYRSKSSKDEALEAWFGHVDLCCACCC